MYPPITLGFSQTFTPTTCSSLPPFDVTHCCCHPTKCSYTHVALKGAESGIRYQVSVSGTDLHSNCNQQGGNTALLQSCTHPTVSQYGSVGIATRLLTAGPTNHGSISSKDSFSFPKCPYRLWSPLSLIFNETRLICLRG